jgi:hypothetical protein
MLERKTGDFRFQYQTSPNSSVSRALTRDTHSLHARDTLDELEKDVEFLTGQLEN